MSTAVLRALSCSFESSRTEVFSRAILVGPGVAKPSLEDSVGGWGLGDRSSCALSLGSMNQLMKEMGNHSGKVFTGEGSRIKFSGLLNSVVFAWYQALGKGTPVHESTKGSFHHLFGILKIIAYPSFFPRPDFGLTCK